MTGPHAETLRRHAFDRPGYRLISYAEIALPMSLLTLDALVQERKPLPALDEFVLASIGAGISSIDDIGSFLGLERPLVERTVLAQWNLDHVDERVVADKRSLSLTPQGESTLRTLEAITPERTDMTIPFDRLLWQPVRVQPADLVHPADVKESQIVEVRAAKAQRPSLRDVSVETVNPVLKELLRSRGINLDLLSILAVQRTDRRYASGLLLVYEGQQPSDIELAVSVDGRISADHSTALNRLGGLDWLGVTYDSSEQSQEGPRLDSSLLQALPPIETEERLQLRLARAEAALAGEADEDLPSDDASGGAPGVDPRGEVVAARAAIDALPLRRVLVFEHTILLWEALKTARSRLLLLSPWVKKGVVNSEFLEALETLAQRKVRITIGYGLHSSRYVGGMADDTDAVKSLEGLARRFENVQVHKLGNTHEKILIWDNNWITTSFNWLSFRGDPNLTLRRESGFLVRGSDLVGPAYEEFMSEIEESPGESPGSSAWTPEVGFRNGDEA